MNRDAKIGIVVILIIVGVLFIIWGRQPKDATTEGTGAPVQDSVISSLTNAVPAPPTGTAPTAGGAASILTEILPTAPPTGPTDAAVAPPTSPVPPPPATLTEYTVRPGDVLEKIAAEQLGDRSRVAEIVKLNNLTNPDSLRVGQKLKLPAKGSAPAAAATVDTAVSGAVPAGVIDAPAEAPVEAAEPAVVVRREGQPTVEVPFTTRTTSERTASGSSKYTVKTGDKGLIQIAREQLGDATKWKAIADLNGLNEPYALEVGQVLVLPE